MPLQRLAAQLYAFALLYISAQCLRYAIQGFAKPLRLNTNPCNTIAIQLISIHRHCGSNRRSSNLRLSKSSRILSPPCRRVAIHFSALPLLNVAVQAVALAEQLIALPLLFNSEHCISLPPHYISMLFAALAILYISSPCLCCSTQVTSLPRNTAASLRVLHSAIA